MGLKSIPSINIFVNDKSDMANIGVAGNVVGLLLNGERGFEELISLDRSTFYKYFTDVNKSFNKVEYVGASRIVDYASEVIIGAVSKNAKYGGVYITDRGIVPFRYGVSSYKSLSSDNIYPFVNVSYNNFVGNVSSNVLDFSKGVALGNKITVVYSLGGSSKRIDVVNGDYVDSNISSLDIDYNTGEFSINFVVKPDGDVYSVEYYAFSDVYSGKINKGSGDGVEVDFSFIISDSSIRLDSVYVYYRIGGVDYVGKSDSSGVITGDEISSGSVVYDSVNKRYSVSIEFETAPDSGSNIFVSYVSVYKFLCCILAKGNKSWSKNYGYKVLSYDISSKSFVVGEFERLDDGSSFMLNSYEVSRDVNGVDRYGRGNFIESVFEGSSVYGIAVNNDEYSDELVRVVDGGVVWMDGGDDGDDVSSAEYVSMVNKFKDEKIYFNFFCGNGITNKSVLDEISNLVVLKNKQAFLDVVDGSSVDDIVSWAEVNIPDNMRCFWYSPFVFVSAFGGVYYCGVSALVCAKQCYLVNIGKPFMSVSGVGYGSLDGVVRLAHYFNNDGHKKLAGVGVNCVRFKKDLGILAFDNITGQKKYSGTSFINSVLTLNYMIENFENILPQLQLNRVINAETFVVVRQLIESFLRVLEINEGTIEPAGSKYGWIVRIDENNDLAIERKEINVEVIFSFQSVLRTINLNLTYMSNNMIVKFR